MNYKKLVFAACCLGLLFFTACKDKIVEVSPDNDSNIARTLSGGTFNYTAYDSLGAIVAGGTISFEIQDTTNITGEWEINKVGDPKNIGPQTGSGKLEGNLTDESLMIGLNPDFRDNNVFLEGKPEENKYTGKWYYSSFIGLTNWGTFVAEKK